MTPDASRRAILVGGALLPLSRAVPRDAGRLAPAASIPLRRFGADPTGRASAVAAFERALAAGETISGLSGDIYLLDAPVVVPGGRSLLGNGATLRLAKGGIGLRLHHDRCNVAGWRIEGNDGLYAVLNTGRHNRFVDNTCTGNVGHFFFSTKAEYVVASGNSVEGLSADREITTAILVEDCRNITIARNRFREIPVGWSIQVRAGSRDFIVADNDFRQTRWTISAVPFAGQRRFEMTLGSVCHLKKVQVNGKPMSTGYVITGRGPTYTVTFDKGMSPSDTVTLVGYRGAENIQINTGSRFGTITDNRIDGTGDSGIVCFGSNLYVAGNIISNCGYAGIAIYGGQNDIIVSGNTITDCAQLDDALSSPDDPRQASVFAGAILASGENAVIVDNVIRNPGGTMRYGIRINNTDMALRTDGTAAITIMRNRYEGSFADGCVFAPNDTSGARINSLAVDGAVTSYPGHIDLDAPWTNAPPCGAHIRASGFGTTWAIRDPGVTRRPGAVSMRTVAGEYIDLALSAAALLRDCNVTIGFWAKAGSGTSYASVFTVLAGLSYPLTATITDKEWKRYEISFPLTANLEDVILIRLGAQQGSANIQDIEIAARKL